MAGMGIRSKRYAMVVDNGVVRKLRCVTAMKRRSRGVGGGGACAWVCVGGGEHTGIRKLVCAHGLLTYELAARRPASPR